MDNIVKNSADNIGGLVTLFFIPVEDVLSTIIEPIDGVVLNPVLLKPSKNWFSAEIVQESLGYTETQVRGNDGNKISSAVSGFVAGNSSRLTSLFNEMIEKRYMVLAQDPDYKLALLGTPDNGLFFQCNFDSKDKFSGRKGYGISFYTDSCSFSPYYLSTFTYYPSISEPVASGDVQALFSSVNTLNVLYSTLASTMVAYNVRITTLESGRVSQAVGSFTGNGVATSFFIPHSLNNTDVDVEIINNLLETSNPKITRSLTGVTVDFTSAVSNGLVFKIVVTGIIL